MAETARGKKIVKVHSYTRADGTIVPAHDCSTTDTSKGPAKHSTPRRTRGKSSG
jgi:hypothetical protein